MKLRFISNACCIYQSQDKKILCDPWLVDGAFYGSWFHYPPLKTRPEDVKDYDYLYISHLHPDHFDPLTLQHFDKSKPVIVLDHGGNYLHRALNDLGFLNLLKIKDGDTKQVGPFELTMYAPFVGNPFFKTEIGNLIDSALVVKADGITIFNANDNTPTLEACRMIKEKHGPITAAQLNYNAAGMYPSCHMGLTTDQNLEEHTRILKRNLDNFVAMGKELNPRYLIPFAGSYVIGGKNWHKNYYLGTTTPQEVLQYCRNRQLYNCTPMYENEIINFDYLESIYQNPPTTIDQMTYIKDVLAEKKYPYEENVPRFKDEEKAKIYFEEFIWPLLEKARANLWKAQQRFGIFKEYDVTIETALELGCTFNLSRESFGKSECHPGITFYLHHNLLRGILERKYHFNNCEIGTHVEFDRFPDIYDPDIHTLMSFFHC